eukprot:snap_masked-scaffold_7-processed-gene-12.8-mRNA-1 protein AED:0.28 eAED:0.29 QI:0/0.5/0.66/1/1/1/3/25/97
MVRNFLVSNSNVGKANINISVSRNWEHLESQYVGTGHPDIKKQVWIANQHRDSLASHIGRKDFLLYLSTAQNKSTETIRVQLLNRMINPLKENSNSR